MAWQPNKPVEKRPWKYVYINDELCKILAVNKAADKVWVFSFTEDRRKMFAWSTVKNTAEKAYSIIDVANLLGLFQLTVRRAMLRGDIKKPQQSYPIGQKPEERIPNKIVWRYSESDVYDIHEYFANKSRGRERYDGFPIRKNFITKEALRMKLNNGQLVFVQDEKGDMIPAWKEHIK